MRNKCKENVTDLCSISHEMFPSEVADTGKNCGIGHVFPFMHFLKDTSKSTSTRLGSIGLFVLISNRFRKQQHTKVRSNQLLYRQ